MTRPHGTWLMPILVALLCSMVEIPAQGSQFFGKDILPTYDDSYFYAVFMQHAQTSHSSGFVHEGIDVAADAGWSVASPNIDAGGSVPRARVVYVSSDAHGVMIARDKGDAQTEAVLLGHINPRSDWVDLPPNQLPFLDHSQLVGFVEEGKDHVHANLYEGFPEGYVWDGDVPKGAGISQDDMRSYLVNPLTNAFEQAPWITDQRAPTISDFDVYRVTNPNCYLARVRTYDTNDALWTYSYCKTGVYKINLYVDREGATPADAIEFEEWHGSAADFYFYPDSPPNDACNQWDGLYYQLEWDYYDENTHDFIAKVCDAAGNCERMLTRPTGEVPPIVLKCRATGPQVRVSWQLPEEWRVRDLELRRSCQGAGVPSPETRIPVASMHSQGNSVLEYEVLDAVPTKEDWITARYLLYAITDEGKERLLGAGSAQNPHWVGGRIRVTPNPFAEGVSLGFWNTSAGRVQVRIYDIGGRLVRALLDTSLGDGWATQEWDGRDGHGQVVSPGVYFAAVTRAGSTSVAKIVRVY